MSSGKECEIIETTPGQWVYLLEADQNDWDWREAADCYGPFPSEITAHDHLRANHANPGGYGLVPHTRISPTLTKIIEAKMAELAREEGEIPTDIQAMSDDELLAELAR